MATPVEEDQQEPISGNPNADEPSNGVATSVEPISENPDSDEPSEGEDEEFDEDEEEEEEEEEEERTPLTEELRLRSEKSKLEKLLRRLSTERVILRVHNVLIKGNIKTKESLIEAEVEALNNANTMQEILEAAGVASARLHRLGVFDDISISIEAGPPELPNTANVIIEVVEAQNPLSGDIGIFTKPEARSWSLEGAIKWKNLLGYGDIWDGSLAYGWDQTSLSAGVALPRFKGLATPMQARVSLLSQDWLKFSSYKDQSLGFSLGLIQTRYHAVDYNLAWRTLTDPSQMSSRSIRRQLGHGLLSSLKYTFKIDRRNSPLRPTSGYAFVSTTQFGGLSPDSRSLRFLRQDLDFRYAFPLWFSAALNLGLSAGIVFPWGSNFLNKPSPLPERYFLGGNSSPVSSLGGPTTMLGFKTRGLGPTSPRRQINRSNEGENPGSDVIGGDLAVTAFADLSFGLPLKVLTDAGIHGHTFACAGNVTKLTEKEYKNFSFRGFLESFRTCVGVGVVFPLKFFRMEANYCYVLRQFGQDSGKTGIQFSFSSPV